MDFVKINKIVTVFLTLLLSIAISSSTDAHRGDWTPSSVSGMGARIVYYINGLFGWNYFDSQYQNGDPNTSFGAGQVTPLHIAVNRSDNTDTHITFGSDSYHGDYSLFPRYAYYPNWVGQDRWVIRGGYVNGLYDRTYRSGYLTWQQFYNRVTSNIAAYRTYITSDPTNQSLYQTMIDDAEEMLGSGGATGGGADSVLITWWNDFNTPIPPSPASASGTAAGNSNFVLIPAAPNCTSCSSRPKDEL